MTCTRRSLSGLLSLLSNRDRFDAAGIVITHDIASLPALADRVALLDAGSSRFLGTPQDTVFVYHNGAESYYAARGFRGALRVQAVAET